LRGAGDTHDQTGAVLGIAHTRDRDLPVAMLAEATYFTDFGGTSASARYGNGGLAAPFGPATASDTYSNRDVHGLRTEHLATVTGETELAGGLFRSLGYRWTREGADKNQTIGILITYEF
jgi:hypothetical protein